MAYPIQKMHKAHYVLMNIECDQETLDELDHAFKFNDAVLRHLTIKVKEAVITPSPMMREDRARFAETPVVPVVKAVETPVEAPAAAQEAAA
ncbi:MAG: 30S ribosomal protein S6, partial [Sulfuricella sp.]